MPRNTPKMDINSTYKMLFIAKKMEILQQANSHSATNCGVAKVHGITATL